MAQFSRPVSIGLGVGGTSASTDLANTQFKFAYYAEVDGLLTPFISVGIRGEKGSLSGTDFANSFSNSYYTGNLNVKLRLGQFFAHSRDYNWYSLWTSSAYRLLSNTYIGVGGGLLKNKLAPHFALNYIESIQQKGGEMPQNYDGIYLVVPINIGFDVPIGTTLYGPRWALNVNYQHTLTMDDNLDGIVQGEKDHYGFVSVGVKYGLFNRQ
ncbi:hypothetical protein BWD42_07355 [Sphingobacterium sp. CZ-UAM]|nr:hypothetical protein BWD42_07355 [Sphingobacterium sp. CZ-UAM]